MFKGSKNHELKRRRGSATTPLNEARSADWQSPGRSSVNRKRGRYPDLEEKPRFPPQVITGTPADYDANRDLQNAEGKSQRFKASASEALQPASKKKKAKSAKKKMKAPEPDEDGVGSGKISSIWNENALDRAYRRKALHELLDNNPLMRIRATTDR
ncbi:hypothetical protein PI125_g16593 [Phytophthora idaei]|nr:hypothetical protein PI125_g16593 [Phytophthora idaei]KAG3138121.1 hypothetical protein PI126_g17062 [Phytophthora idaei]